MSKYVFITPNQLKNLDIWFPVEETFQDDELDDEFPMLIDELKDYAYQVFVGKPYKGDTRSILTGGEVTVGLVITINGKSSFLDSEDISEGGLSLRGLPDFSLSRQLIIFQRLLRNNLITMDDLAAADIDNNVYKQLAINGLSGEELYRNCCEKLDALQSEQESNPRYPKLTHQIDNL